MQVFLCQMRGIIFPNGVPIEISQASDDSVTPAHTQQPSHAAPKESDNVSTDAEGDLSSEANAINSQAKNSRTPEAGENLLNPKPTDTGT